MNKLFILIVSSLLCMQAQVLVSAEYNLEQLPTDAKNIIVRLLATTDNTQQALQAISNLAKTNKSFAQLLSNSDTRRIIGEALLEKSGTIAQKKRIAQALGIQEYIILVTTPGDLAAKEALAKQLNITHKLWYNQYQALTKQVVALMDDLVSELHKAYAPGQPITAIIEYEGFQTTVQNKLIPLVQQGADMNVTLENGSLFSFFTDTNHISFIEFLIKSGADVNTLASSPLIAIAKNPISTNKSLELLTILLNAGAKIDQQDDQGKTALMYASIYGLIPIVSLLLQQGADTTITDTDGKTALDLALERYNQYINTFFGKPLAEKIEQVLILLQEHSAKIE